MAAVSVRIGCGLATDADGPGAAARAAATARAGLDGADPDLVVVFASGAHLAAPEAMLEAVAEELDPDALIGCGAGGVLAGGREVERATGLAVWAAAFEAGAVVDAFHAQVQQVDEGVAVGGIPDLVGASGAILLPDPTAFPTPHVLEALSQRAPAVPILGGLASALTMGGDGPLFFGEEVVSGAVGVRLEGVEMLPCVSQGAAPLGPEMDVTLADGHTILELDDRPAVEVVREAVLGLEGDERRRMAEGPLLLIGVIVADARLPDGRPDVLVRGLSAEPDGSVDVGTEVRAGQRVQLHTRDPETADRDLRDALDLRRLALGGQPPAGALVFSCNGRGRGMFGTADHDAGAVVDAFGPDVPAAGFFAAGEIGPVGGGTYLHGFTATVAVFAP